MGQMYSRIKNFHFSESLRECNMCVIAPKASVKPQLFITKCDKDSLTLCIYTTRKIY